MCSTLSLGCPSERQAYKPVDPLQPAPHTSARWLIRPHDFCSWPIWPLSVSFIDLCTWKCILKCNNEFIYRYLTMVLLCVQYTALGEIWVNWFQAASQISLSGTDIKAWSFSPLSTAAQSWWDLFPRLPLYRQTSDDAGWEASVWAVFCTGALTTPAPAISYLPK